MREMKDEARLTAYVLGELPDAERAEVEAQIAASDALRREVDDIRATATALRDALALAPRHELSSEQRAAVEKVAGRGRMLRFVVRRRWALAGSLAAAACLIAGALFVFTSNSAVSPYIYPLFDAPASPTVAQRTIPDETRERLRTLGYVQGHSGEARSTTPRVNQEEAEKLKSLGYIGGGAGETNPASPAVREERAIDVSVPRPAALAAQGAGRKLVRTGQMAIEVRDYDEAVRQTQALVEKLGGYVADARTSRGNQDRRYGSLTVRIPTDRFASALAEVKSIGTVVSEDVATQDVTKAYTDLETRLRVKQETAARLRSILRDKTAGLSDVLSVERELARVVEESESLEGERRFYDQQITLSSIALSLSEPDAVVSTGALEPIVTALRSSVQVLSISVAAMLAAVVFVAPWALVVWLLWLLIMRLRRHRAHAQPVR